MIGEPRLKVVFYKSQTSKEPVREWLKSLLPQDKKTLGEDIKTLQFGWPLGMPLIRKLEPGLLDDLSLARKRLSQVRGEG